MQAADHLGDDVGQHVRGREAAARGQADGDGRVEVAARDVADGVGHRQHGQAEGQGHAEEADPDLGESRGEHGAAAAAEHQPERADCLGHVFLRVHGVLPQCDVVDGRAWPRSRACSNARRYMARLPVAEKGASGGFMANCRSVPRLAQCAIGPGGTHGGQPLRRDHHRRRPQWPRLRQLSRQGGAEGPGPGAPAHLRRCRRHRGVRTRLPRPRSSPTS